jgi:DNA-binding NarL/FixJ family response regulator
METIKVVIVDDHQIVRDGLKAMFLVSKTIKVIGEADDYDSLMDLLLTKQPHLAILDISLPGKSGIEITQELSANHPEIKVLILTASNQEETIIEAIRAGASGFLSKETSREELILAVTSVFNNEGYFGAKLSKIIYSSYIHRVKSTTVQQNTNLTEREIEIIKILYEGLSTKEIGEKLFLSPRTVESHKANILEKLNLKNNIELVRYALKQGIVKL